jgi:hypothetical protein
VTAEERAAWDAQVLAAIRGRIDQDSAGETPAEYLIFDELIAPLVMDRDVLARELEHVTWSFHAAHHEPAVSWKDCPRGACARARSALEDHARPG